MQLYLKWQGYSKYTKGVINSLLLCTVYSATPFCFHLRLSSALMETLRMTHWGAVLTSAAPGIKERPPPSKVGPASPLDQCRLLSEIKLPRNEKNDDIDQKNVHPSARTKGTVKKNVFFPRTQKSASMSWIGHQDSASY